MFTLARFSVNRPVAAGIISTALLVLGSFYGFKMPVSLYPEVSFPFVEVKIPFPGASPEQVEAKILKPLESEMAGLPHLKRVIGYARGSGGTVVLGFKMDAKRDEAVAGVRERVSLVRGLFPQGAKEPTIRAIDVGAVPILIYGVESKDSNEKVKAYLDKTLIRMLQRTEGVNEAALMGLGQEELQFRLNESKLSALRVPPIDVFKFLSSVVSVVPWGEVREGDQEISIGRPTLTDDPEYWDNQTVTLQDGRGIRLAELGNHKISRDEMASNIYINGSKGLGLVVTKRADANTVETVKAVKKTIQEFNNNKDKSSNEPSSLNVSFFEVLNQSEFIKENANEVWIALIFGGIFAVFVIMIFLTDLKSAIISATALPVSIAGAFIPMSYFGFSLNMMSLLSLSLAIGLLIDDAVVVRESIFHQLEKGANPKDAAIHGTSKVFSAVLATSLAVIAVFLPVGMMQGMVGQFFKEFGITICIAVTISTWVAFTLDPMLSAHFGGKPKQFQGRFWDKWRKGLLQFDIMVSQLSSKSFHHPMKVILVSVILLFGSMALSLSRGADFLAFEDRGQFLVSLIAPVGSSRESLEKLTLEIKGALRDLDGLKNIYAQVGMPNNPNRVEIRCVFNSKNERKTGLLDIQKMAQERISKITDKALIMDPPPIEGVAAEAPVTVYLYGEDLKQLRLLGNDFVEKLKKVEGIAAARLETSDFSKAYDIEINNDDLAAYGSNYTALEMTGRLVLAGLEMGNVGLDNFPYNLRLNKSERTLPTLLQNVLVPSQRGPIEMNKLVKVSESNRATTIERERRSRKIVIWATLNRKVTYGSVLQSVQKMIDELPQPYFGEMGGDKEVFEEMVSSFTIAIIGSLFFIFVILSIQFENLLRPFIILLSLPLAIIGGLLALFLAGQQLALGALIGMILLIGLAAKNGILLVDSIGVKEKSMPLETAVTESVLERSRPIIMTSIAMIFGMLPTALLRGGGSEFRSPMAIAIIGGVVSSTLLSFLVVPAIFGLLKNLNKYKLRNSVSTALCVSILLYPLLKSIPAFSNGPAHPTYNLQLIPLSVYSGWLKNALKNAPGQLNVEGAKLAAEGAKSSARWAFIGGLRVEVGRQWYRPGFTQNMNIPYYDPRSATLKSAKSSQIVLPKAQNVLTVGWQLPIFNQQVFAGVSLATELNHQSLLVKNAKEEMALSNLIEAILKVSMLREYVTLEELHVADSMRRLRMAEERSQAGLGKGLDATTAKAQSEALKVKVYQRKLELSEALGALESLSGLKPPEVPTGIVQVPTLEKTNFKPNSLVALKSASKVQDLNADISNLVHVPTVFLEAGYEAKSFSGRTSDPQSYLGLKMRWDILDAGSRIRNVAQQRQTAFEARATAKELEVTLNGKFMSLPQKKKELDEAYKAVMESIKSTEHMQQEVLAAYHAGLATMADVQEADFAKLNAQEALVALEVAKQGLKWESWILNGTALDTLDISSR